jgi:non-ribosomal peptide synthase protein (TIGR01720 family)
VPALVRRWLRLYPSIPVINAYGPTEASDDVAHHVMTAPPEGEITPIGRPIRNTRLYVTSAGGQLCPVGVPGELWVSGVCVGRGYVGDEARTRAAFGVDPFDPEAPRLYRTGDQARWLEEGVLEFLGRRDAQVKVRGHRIELAEIESALARDPAVKDAAVLAEPDGRGEKRLVAFLVPVPGGPRGAALAEAARSRLRERLPEYMVPGLVVELDALPLTPNGKVDRRALAALDAPREGVRPNFEAPEGELESRMARAFADVLGVERVGRHDNFFEVGGDSLLVIQTVSRLAREGLLATPALMLQHQTVAELALHVRPMPPGALPAPRPHGSAPFNPIQAWLFEQRFEEMHHWNQCVLVEAVRARLDEGTLRRALEAIHDHHDALRLRYTDEGGRVRQAYDEAARPELEVHDLSGLPAEARGRAVEERVESLQRSLDLERGPLVRAALFEMGDGEPQRLFLVVHHLVVDVPSWAIVLEDLESAAAAIPLAPGSSTFQEYAKRLFEHAQGPEVREEIGFWLAQGEEVAALPLDFQRGPNVEGAMRTVSAGLDPDATAALLRGPTQVALLAALLETLREWTGGGAQRMEFLSHGRQDLLGLDLTRTVGFLTTMAPVRFDAGDLRGEGLRRAVERQLAAVPDGGRGYGLLRYLRQDPDVRDRLARASWPQVGFNYFGQLDAATRSTRFAPARESTGAWHSPKAHRSVQIGLDASVLGGRMNLVWSYSENLHRRETAQRWAERYRELLLAHLGGAT